MNRAVEKDHRRIPLWVLYAASSVAMVALGVVTFAPRTIDPGTTAQFTQPTSEMPLIARYDGPSLTNISEIVDADDPAGLAGRDVALDNVQVVELVGEKTMLVRNDAGDELVIVVPDQNTSATRVGQRLDVAGTLRNVSDTLAPEVGDIVFLWATITDGQEQS